MRVERINMDELSAKSLDLGFVGEQNHTKIIITCAMMFKNYPDAVATMVANPPVGDMYPVQLTRDGNTLEWDVSTSDLAYAGSGSYQLTFTENNEIIKVEYGSYFVKPSMTATGEPPTPIEDWMQEATGALEALEEISASASTLAAGSSATAQITTVEGHKNIAIGIPKGDKGDTGNTGADGYSPTATVSKSGTTATITITDKTGTTTATVSDGVATDAQVTTAVDTYLAANFSNPSNPPLDRTLLSSSSAAPADLVGDLKSAINQNFSDVVDIEQGYWAIADGAATASTTWCRSKGFVDKRLVLKSTIKMFLLAYNKLTGAYVGTWNGTEFSTTYNSNAYLYIISFPEWTVKYPDYKFVVDFSSSSTITPSDVLSALTILNYDRVIESTASVKLTPSTVYENGEAGSANMYERFPSGAVNNRGRAKKEYIQRIPKGATNLRFTLDASAFANGRYKIGFAQYDKDYGQISGKIKGWYTSPQSITDTISESAVYFMFYYAPVGANDTVDIATLPLNGCHVIFDNSPVDFGAQLLNPTTVTLYPKVDERLIALETNETGNANDMFVFSINHRGYSTTAPENTIPAYIMSKKMGFSYAECDVEFTSDGVAVLLHDSTINRTARNADGTAIASTISIGDITYEQALTFDFGIWKGSQYAGTKIPTFEEFIVACKKLSLHPVVELKDVVNGTYWTDARIAVVANTIKKIGMEENVAFISFAKTALEKIMAIFPKAMIGLGLEGSYTEENFATYIENAESLLSNDHIVAATVDYSSMTDALYTQLTNAGIHPIAWTVNTENAVLGLNSSVIGVLSDSVNAGEVYLRNMLSQV